MYTNQQKAYRVHKGHAKARDIPWLFTYVSWRITWARSGHWHERGRLKGQYVMSRLRDKGPYSPGNVRIVQVGTNVSEAQLGWPQKRDPKVFKEHCRKTSKTLTGTKQSPEHRKNNSEAQRKRWERYQVS